jgi:putative thioredoxin
MKENMMFDTNNLSPNSPANSNEGAVFDADLNNFEDAVMKASATTPILVDFWSPSCGPCKQLTPVLEQLVGATGGAVKLAKINVDQNSQLAMMFQVQSVPTVFSFYQGQPVTAFTGNQPQSEIQKLIDHLIQMSGGTVNAPGIDIEETLAGATAAMQDKNYPAALNLFGQILEQEPEHEKAYAGLARALIESSQMDEATEFLNEAPASLADKPEVVAAKKVLSLISVDLPPSNLQELQQKLNKKPDDHQTRFDLAMGLFSSGRAEQAIDELIEIIRRNREWEDEKARKQLLDFFEALGQTHELTSQGRRKLSSVLFS